MTLWLRRAFLAVLGLLLVHNLLRAAENQRDLPCREWICAQPRDLEQLAAEGPPKIAAVSGVFYYLGRRLPDATLTIPPWMEKYRWELEHITRVRVEVSAASLLVDPAKIDPLRGGGRRRWMRRGGSEGRWLFQDIHVVVDDSATRYVLAEEGATWGALFVIPAARFEEVRVR